MELVMYWKQNKQNKTKSRFFSKQLVTTKRTSNSVEWDALTYSTPLAFVAPWRRKRQAPGCVETWWFPPVKVAEANRTRKKGSRVYTTECVSILYPVIFSSTLDWVYHERFLQHCENFTEIEETHNPPSQHFVWTREMSYLPRMLTLNRSQVHFPTI